jgi:hypothetical protein
MIISLPEIVSAHLLSMGGHEYGKADLSMLWQNIIISDLPNDLLTLFTVEQATLTAVQCATEGSQPLEFSPGGWRIKVGDAVLKSAIMTGVTAGIFVLAGFPDLTPTALSMVIPFLFDVEKVRLDVSQQRLHAMLIAREGVLDQTVQIEVLYKKLPKAIRQELSYLDFCDFIETCRQSGVASEMGGGMRMHSLSNPRARLTIV